MSYEWYVSSKYEFISQTVCEVNFGILLYIYNYLCKIYVVLFDWKFI